MLYHVFRVYDHIVDTYFFLVTFKYLNELFKYITFRLIF